MTSEAVTAAEYTLGWRAPGPGVLQFPGIPLPLSLLE